MEVSREDGWMMTIRPVRRRISAERPSRETEFSKYVVGGQINISPFKSLYLLNGTRTSGFVS